MASSIERFRRVAINNNVPIDENTSLSVQEEIEHLQSGLNAVVFKTSEKWMMPSWASKQGVDSQAETMPNTSYRNWAVVGGVGSHRFGITDEFGLLQVNPACGSIEFWLENEEGILLPVLLEEPIKLDLLTPEDQVYEWRTTIGPIEFTRLIYYVKNGENESIYNEISVRNFSLEKKDFKFFAALRPISVKGVEPIENINFDGENNVIYANDVLACMMSESPSAVVLSSHDNSILLQSISDMDQKDNDYSSAQGLGSGVLRFDLSLTPAGFETIFFVSPLESFTKNEEIPSFTMESNARDAAIEDWFSFSGRRMAGVYPDDNIIEIFSQAKASLVIQAYNFIFNEESFNSLTDFIEKARILFNLTLTGCLETLEQCSVELADRITDETNRTPVEFVTPILWASLRHLELTKNQEFFEKIDHLIDYALPHILSHSYHSVPHPVVLKTEKPELELKPVEEELPEEVQEKLEELDLADIEAPSSVVEELEGPEEPEEKPDPVPKDALPEMISEALGSDEWLTLEEKKAHDSVEEHYFGIMREIWNIAVLRFLSDIDIIGSPALAEVIQLLLEPYESELKKQLGTILDLELTPYQSLDLVSSMIITATNDLDPVILDKFMESKVRSNIKRGLFKISAPHELFSSHLSLRIAQYYAINRKRHYAEQIFSKSIEYVSEYSLLPDAINIKTYGGSYGDGCSIKAAADLILLARYMMLFEEEENYILLSGIPEEWFSSTSPLIIEGLPTRIGPVTLELGTSANQHQVELKMDSLPTEIELHVPHSFSIPLVKVYGGAVVGRFPDEESPHVKVVPLNDRIIITFHK